MNSELLRRIQIISEEEQAYLDGAEDVKREIYTHKDLFEIDRELFLDKDSLVTVRPHSRFVDFPEHRHNYIEIMYVCDGSITHYIENKVLVMEKGDILLMNQQVRHSVKRAGIHDIGINFITLPEFFDIPLQMLHGDNILADFLISTLRQKQQKPQYLLFHLKENSTIDNLMENMIASMIYEEENTDAENQYSMGLVFLYLLKHVDSLTQNSSQNYHDVVLQSALRYVENSYKTANLTKIAADLHQSVSAMSKLIKQDTGCTFQELLQRKRFQKAGMLLLETDMPVEEIAEEVGYENQSYFYRQFKVRYGMTPRKYRLQYGGQ